MAIDLERRDRIKEHLEKMLPDNITNLVVSTSPGVHVVGVYFSLNLPEGRHSMHQFHKREPFEDATDEQLAGVLAGLILDACVHHLWSEDRRANHP